jgi:hypothetical protein
MIVAYSLRQCWLNRLLDESGATNAFKLTDDPLPAGLAGPAAGR